MTTKQSKQSHLFLASFGCHRALGASGFLFACFLPCQLHLLDVLVDILDRGSVLGLAFSAGKLIRGTGGQVLLKVDNDVHSCLDKLIEELGTLLDVFSRFGEISLSKGEQWQKC